MRGQHKLLEPSNLTIFSIALSLYCTGARGQYVLNAFARNPNLPHAGYIDPMPTAPAAPHWSTLPNAPAPGTALMCQRDALTDGQATLWELDTGDGPGQPFKLLLLRNGSAVTAFANRCAHFGVPLAARQSQLIFTPLVSITCNVHYARYRWADGVCEGGECAGESLVPVPLHISENGALCIATNGG